MVFDIEKTQVLLTGKLQHFGYGRWRRNGYFGAVAGRVAVLRHSWWRGRGGGYRRDCRVVILCFAYGAFG